MSVKEYNAEVHEIITILKGEEMDQNEIKCLRRKVEDILRKNNAATLLIAAILIDNNFLDISRALGE